MMTNQGEVYQFSEAHYRLAMAAAGIGLWDWDLHQDRQVWNNQCKALFGLAPEDENTGYQRFLTLLHPDDRERVSHLIKEALAGHAKYQAEYRTIWPNGSEHWIGARGRGIYDDTGKAVRMIGVVFEVTARKEVEAVQGQANSLMREILNSIQEAFAHLDRDWRFTYANSRATRIEGYMPEEKILGRRFWEVYPQLLGTTTERHLRQVMESRQPVAYETYYPNLQSWYDVRAYPTEEGGITVFLTDITERKTLEQERDQLLEQERAVRREAEAARQRSDELVEQLERKRAFLHAIMNQVPSGLMIAEAPRGNVILYSEEAARLLGREHLEVQNYMDYIQYRALHPDGTRYRAEDYPLARALRKGELVLQEDMAYEWKDGRLGHLIISAAPIRDAHGHTVAAVATFNDASERYELERKKDEFISMASHELRTPLTSIKGNLQMMQRRLQRFIEEHSDTLGECDWELARALAQWSERALRQANVESRLINDLLDASRIQTAQLRIVPEPGNLVQIVRDTVNDIQVSEDRRTIYLDLPPQSDIPVMADRVRIGQVVTNYISNALKYSPNDQPVWVGLEQAGDEGCVWVRDAGPGIAPEALRYIWDRFRQVGSFVDYTRLGRGGLGLGLYINRAVVELHGGRSGVESVPGKGSTFWFTLPIASR
ncbi:MAG TPA: PAS domain S-box protein [Ktedonobacteraceae bacterium]